MQAESRCILLMRENKELKLKMMGRYGENSDINSILHDAKVGSLSGVKEPEQLKERLYSIISELQNVVGKLNNTNS